MTQIEMPARVESERTLRGALWAAVVGALGAAFKAIALHFIALGLLIGVIAWWGASGAGFWRGTAGVGTALVIHAAVAPFVVFWTAVLAAGTGVKRFGVARLVFAAAARRAEAIDPQLRERNDFGEISRALAAALDSLAEEPVGAVEGAGPGRLRRMMRLGRRVAKRVVRVVARVILRQFELIPHPDGRVDFATVDDWMGARVDSIATEAIQAPARRWIAILLVVQFVGTTGAVFAAWHAPPLW